MRDGRTTVHYQQPVQREVNSTGIQGLSISKSDSTSERKVVSFEVRGDHKVLRKPRNYLSATCSVVPDQGFIEILENTPSEEIVRHIGVKVGRGIVRLVGKR